MYADKRDLILLSLVTIVSMMILFVDINNSSAVSHQTVTVCEGDTIWSFGEKFAQKGEDVRIVVERIYKVNNLDERSFIQPGQTLLIPVHADETMNLAKLKTDNKNE